MTTTESGKDVFNRIVNAAKQFNEFGGLGSAVQNNDLKEERREWREHQEEVRRKYQQNPFLYYAAKIRGTVPDYEISFEEHMKDVTESMKARSEAAINEPEEEFIFRSPPKKMTELER